MFAKKTWSLICVVPLLGLVGSCGTDRSPDPASASYPGAQHPTAEERGYYKVGRPYQVAGLWYYPREDFGYVETGTASWYGPDFHGLPTANGEKYDMYAFTAAHPTLQMPSIVRVTNLDNGRSTVLRVNDRGPFASSRIIDVSYQAAQALGFANRGTAKVRVEVLPEESRHVAALARDGATGRRQDEFVARRHEPAPAQPRVQLASYAYAAPGSPRPAALFVQAGAFAQRENADRLRTELSRYGATLIDAVQANGRTLYRVRLGPLGSVEAADSTLSSLVQNGYSVAQIVVE